MPNGDDGLVFFVSSAGDTDLAVATANKIVALGSERPVFMVPLTSVAANRLGTIDSRIKIFSDFLSWVPEQNEALEDFISLNNIRQAVIGVPSPNDQTSPFKIAVALSSTMSCTMICEFMFSPPQEHALWHYLTELSQKCFFTVPLQSAQEALGLSQEKTDIIGHLSIDRAFEVTPALDEDAVLRQLGVDSAQQLAFISGSTQAMSLDNDLLETLLAELDTGSYSDLQLRFGIHPSVQNIHAYVAQLVTTCSKYSRALTQFKIILPEAVKNKLTISSDDRPSGMVIDSNIFMTAEVSGADAAAVASRVAQAVPGALLNTAAMTGKVAYCLENSGSYLPKSIFADNATAFFQRSSGTRCSKDMLGAPSENCPTMLAASISRRYS